MLGIAGAAEPAATPFISPGELISIYGVQLGPDPAVNAVLDSTGKIATELAGYRVLVNGIPAPLLYAGAHQINLVIPFGIANATEAAVQVITPAGPLPAVTGFSVGPTEPQVFPAILNEDGSINSQSHPAPRGSIVAVWATGGGAMDTGMVDGEISQAPLGKPLLPVGIGLSHLYPGQGGEVTYAGAAPGMVAGVIQINFRVPPPSSNHGACYGACPVVLGVGGRVSLSQFITTVFTTLDPVLWVGN